MSKEFNPESDVKEQIEQLLLEIKDLVNRRKKTTDAQAVKVLTGQIKDLEDQVSFFQRQLPENKNT